MRIVGGYGESAEIDALIWWSTRGPRRIFGFLVPYRRDSTIFIVIPSLYSRYRIHIARTYTRGSEAQKRAYARIYARVTERHRAQCSSK